MRVGFHGGYHGSSEVVDFSVNTNPLGVLKELYPLMRECLGRAERYPDPEYAYLREAIASLYGVQPELIIPLNGASEGIHAATMALRPDNIVTVSPTYGEEDISLLASIVQARVSALIMDSIGDNFYFDVDSLADMVKGLEGKTLVYMSNPNNPTGLRISWDTILEISENLPHTASIIVDEAYMELSTGRISLPRIVPGNVIILRSLTKYLAIPGLRIGFVYAGPDSIDLVARTLPPWNVNAIAECTLSRLLGEHGASIARYVYSAYELIESERRRVMGELRRSGYRVYESQANYILLRHDWIETGKLVARALEKGIYLRRGDTFTGLGVNYTRTSLRRPEENDKLLEVLLEIALETA